MRPLHTAALYACAFALALPASACAQATTNPAQAPATGTIPKGMPAARAAALGGWWNDVVFYEVFVRSFADSTTGPLANDGIGDFQGLIERLDYLKDLGVGALWLMPITESPSYHGYDTTDYRTIERDYGTNDDFKRFMAECRKRNIKVVIDFVINHCSDEHPWFKQASADPQSLKRDWFIWEKTRPTWKGPWNQTVWHANPAPGQSGFYYGMFNHDMPDLNFRNQGATAEIHDTAKFWLTEMGVDGFRLDAIRHLIEDGSVQENTPETHAWLKGFQTWCKSVRPDCFTVGEIWAGTHDIAGYVNGGEMDSAFEFELEGKLVESIKSGRAAPLAEAMRASFVSFPPGTYSTFLTNHDQGRIMTALKGDAAKARAAVSVLLTMPGIPFLYYGEEIGMTGDKPDPKIRTPMQWSSGPNAGFTAPAAKPWQRPNADTESTNVAAQAQKPGSLLEHYRRLIAVRNDSEALRRGDLQVVPLSASHPSLLAFTRSRGHETVLVLANLGADPSPIPMDQLPPALRERLPGSTDLLTGNQLAAEAIAHPDPLAAGNAWIVRLAR
ncbi:MAG: alpha-amylase family glycosyl hydrolase [Phycisphaerales bacterium]|nr:alpha-amylase family glycosyl hydrolase [Phycisphaerales bacterium]